MKSKDIPYNLMKDLIKSVQKRARYFNIVMSTEDNWIIQVSGFSDKDFEYFKGKDLTKLLEKTLIYLSKSQGEGK